MFFLLCVFFLFSIFAEQAVIISPIPGNWSNFQSLVIHVPENTNVYYSFTGSDPLVSGFAYDRPILIEKIGEITLRVVTVHNEVLQGEQKVSFVVTPVPLKTDFFNEAQSSPYLTISPDKPLSIPENFLYSIGEESAPYISGRTLSIDKNNNLTRVVPLLLKNEQNLYRFMLKIQPVETSEKIAESTSVFPFKIECSDWTNFSFSPAEKFFVSVDNGNWFSEDFSLSLERNIPHTISWKEKESEIVHTQILPIKPEILKYSHSSSINSAINLIISDPRFSFSSEHEKMLTSYNIDTVYGDELAGTIDFNIYFAGVFQGIIPVTVVLDKKPPVAPVFVSDSNVFYSRKPITLSLNSDGEIYYKIVTPIISDFGFDEHSDFTKIMSEQTDSETEFEKYNIAGITLQGSKNGAVFYNVEAYAVDFAGNKSEVSSFSSIVDPHNYYVVSHALSTNKFPADGSPAKPYSDLPKLIETLNQSKEFVRIHLDGSFISIPSLSVKTECEIIGSGGSKIEFENGEGFFLDGAKLTISNCIIEQNNKYENSNKIDSKTVTPEELYGINLFTVNNGTLILNQCEIVGILGLNGSVLKAQNSLVQIIDTGITGQTTKYNALITAMNCSVDITNSRFVSIAPTAVCFTMNLGTIDMRNSGCTLIADMARVGEFSRMDCRFANNIFKNENSDENQKALWIDKRSRLLENYNNTFEGFSSEVF